MDLCPPKGFVTTSRYDHALPKRHQQQQLIFFLAISFAGGRVIIYSLFLVLDKAFAPNFAIDSPSFATVVIAFATFRILLYVLVLVRTSTTSSWRRRIQCSIFPPPLRCRGIGFPIYPSSATQK